MTTIITSFTWACRCVCQNVKELTNALAFNAFALIQQSSAPPRTVSEVPEDDWVDLGKDSDSDVPEVDLETLKIRDPQKKDVSSQEDLEDLDSDFSGSDAMLPEIDLRTLKIIPHKKL